MAKFNLLVQDGSAVHPDPLDARDLDAARSEAVVLAGQLLKDADGNFWKQGANWRVDITNGEGQILNSLLIIGIAGYRDEPLPGIGGIVSPPSK